MDLLRKKIVVYGRVQGVGFRYFVCGAAKKYKISGYVENAYDGSVLIEAEGEKIYLEAFIDWIRQGDRYIDVRKMDISDLPVSGKKALWFVIKFLFQFQSVLVCIIHGISVCGTLRYMGHIAFFIN